MTADNPQDTSQTTQGTEGAESKGPKIDLTELTQKLAELAENQKVTMEAVGNMARSQRQPEPPVEENLYDPNTLLQKSREASRQEIQNSRSIDLKIAEIASEYPEVHQDAKLIQAVETERRKLSAAVRDTADGYEHAMLRAVNKAGLIPKSKRQVAQTDPDFSFGSGNQRAERGAKKSKATSDQMELARLLGRPVDDPKYVESLEKTISSREDFGKWE